MLPVPAVASEALSMYSVVCTVVSVMPYMLTSRGASSACRSYHWASRPNSRASPPKMTKRRASSAPVSGSSASAWISW